MHLKTQYCRTHSSSICLPNSGFTNLWPGSSNQLLALWLPLGTAKVEGVGCGQHCSLLLQECPHWHSSARSRNTLCSNLPRILFVRATGSKDIKITSLKHHLQPVMLWLNVSPKYNTKGLTGMKAWILFSAYFIISKRKITANRALNPWNENKEKEMDFIYLWASPRCKTI